MPAGDAAPATPAAIVSGAAPKSMTIETLLPEAGETVDTITSLDDVKMLDVRLNRLRRWHTDGLLCIGDAAHAMSPVGGVGVNLAVQDAVAAANILCEPLRANAVTRDHLAAVQERRTFPMRVIQRMQVIVQNKLLSPALKSTDRPKPPFVLELLRWFPVLRRIPARFIGLGVRPERIHTPERAV